MNIYDIEGGGRGGGGGGDDSSLIVIACLCACFVSAGLGYWAYSMGYLGDLSSLFGTTPPPITDPVVSDPGTTEQDQPEGGGNDKKKKKKKHKKGGGGGNNKGGGNGGGGGGNNKGGNGGKCSDLGSAKKHKVDASNSYDARSGVASASKCCEWCKSDSGCNAWSYSKQSKYCTKYKGAVKLKSESENWYAKILRTKSNNPKGGGNNPKGGSNNPKGSNQPKNHLVQGFYDIYFENKKLTSCDFPFDVAATEYGTDVYQIYCGARGNVGKNGYLNTNLEIARGPKPDFFKLQYLGNGLFKMMNNGRVLKFKKA